MCENFVAFGLILRLILLPKPSGFGPIDVPCKSNSSRNLYNKIPKQCARSCTTFGSQTRNFSLYSLNFHPKCSSQAPEFGNFQLTSPQIWKFSIHKPQIWKFQFTSPTLFRGKYQFASPTLRKSGPHTLPEKRSWVPPPPVYGPQLLFSLRLHLPDPD